MSTVVASNLHFEPTANNRIQIQNNVLGIYDSGIRKLGANSTHLVFKNNTAEGNLWVFGTPIEPGMYFVGVNFQGTPEGFVVAGNSYSKNLYANLYSKFSNSAGSLVFQYSSTGSGYTFGYGNGNFVAFWNTAIGFVRSTDGLTWSNSGITQPGNGGITVTTRTIAYGNGVFLAGGANGRITRSTNEGNTWSNVYYVAGNSDINRIFYGNGIFVLTTNTGTVSRSTDNGLTWSNAVTVGSSDEPSFFKNGEYVNGNFVMIKPGSGSTNGAIMYSNDGITWSNSTGFSSNTGGVNYGTIPLEYRGMAYGHLGFIAVSNYANLAVSNDGITWSYLNYPNTVTWGRDSYNEFRLGSGTEAFYFGGKYIVGRGTNNRKLVSSDLVNWVTVDMTRPELSKSGSNGSVLKSAPNSPVLFSVYAVGGGYSTSPTPTGLSLSANLFVTTPTDKFYVPEHPLVSNTNPYYTAFVKV